MRQDRNLRKFCRHAASATVIALAVCQFASSTAAFAQASTNAQAYASAPADHLLVTKGGVDMRSGKYNFSQTDLSIGEEGSALALVRASRQGPMTHALPFGNFTHNWDMFIVEKRIDITAGHYEGSGPDYRLTAYTGGGAEAFDGRASLTVFGGISKGPVSWLTYTGDRSTGTAVYTLQKTDGTLITFRPINSGDCMTYQRCAYASQIVEPDGTVLKFEYDQLPGGGVNTTRLRSVSSNRGYALLFEYSGTSVSKACVLNLAITPKPSGNNCPSGVKASTYVYGYASGVVLTSVTDPGNATWSYTYGTSGVAQTIGFVKPGASSPYLTNTYGSSISADDVHDVVYSQNFADGQSYQYEYTDIPGQTNGTINQIAGGVVTDAQGHTISVQYGLPMLPRTLTPGYNSGQEETLPNPGDPGDPGGGGFVRIYQITPGPVSVTDELGRTTTYEYCDPVVAAALPSTEYDRCVVLPLRYYTDPEGMRTDVTFGANGLIGSAVRHPKPGSLLGNLTLVVSYAPCLWYPNSCTKPESTLDANGNVTHFGYTSFGEPEWEISPPPTSGAARALKLYTYVQKYAYVSNGGALVPAATPVWVRASETVCQTVAGTGTGRPSSTPACDSTAQITTTTFEYGPNGTAGNLRVRGALVSSGGESLRTCYGYNPDGNKIWTTSPRAGLAACN